MQNEVSAENRDIPESKQTQASFVGPGDLLETLLSNSVDCIYFKDLESRFVCVSHSFLELFKLTNPDQLKGKTAFDILTIEQARCALEEEQKIIQTGQPVLNKLEKETHNDGRITWTLTSKMPWRDKTGTIIGIMGISKDITEYKQREQELEWKTAFLKAQINPSNDAWLIVDNQGKKLLQNQRVNDLWKIPQSIADNSDDTVQVEFVTSRVKDPKQFHARIKYLYAHPHETSHDEIELIDGTVLDRYSYPCEAENGTYYGRIWTFRDITERKRAQERTVESEQKYRNLFEGSRDALMTLEPPSWRFTSANPAALKMFNAKNEEEFLSHAPWELSPERQPDGLDSTNQAKKMIEKALSEGSHFFEWTHRRIGGDKFPATVLLSRMQAGEKVFLQASVRDITTLKQAQDGLRSAEAKFRSLVEQSLFGTYIIQDDRFIYVSPRFAQIFGYHQDEIVMVKSIFDLVSDEDRALVTKNLHKRLSGEVRTAQYAFRAPRKDGTLIDVEVHGSRADLDGHPVVIGALLDITDRKRAEEQVKEQADLLDKTRDAILVRDLEGKVLYWNKGAERVYGWTREEVVGRNVAEILHVDPKKFEELNGLTISQGEWSGEVQHFDRNRHQITSDVRCTLIRDNEGNPKSILSINTDITERKKIEAQFMRAQRMESIGTLAGGIAHDLNNILAPIMMSIDILKTTKNDPQTRNILETIGVSAKRGADIVRQVLSFARGLEGQRIEVQPKHLLKDLGNIIKDTFPKDIQLQFSIPKDTWTILGDPTQVHQILLNLCVNARDAMPNGGCLTIGVENCVIDEQYVAMNPQAKAGRYVNISVTDTGTGIPPELIDKIFEPFFTTKELHKGTGLGLSTVMAIVKSHEGIIDVHSEPGKGTTFKVYLPAMKLSSETLKKETQLVSPPRGKGETILVVDDEASILTITSQTLQAFGYRVLTATDGADAVAFYTEHKNEIAVVLTDMMMPLMDGPATIHALTRINPAIKIVAVSGLNAKGGVAKVSGIGVKHWLTKPYTAGTLLKTIRAILDEV